MNVRQLVQNKRDEILKLAAEHGAVVPVFSKRTARTHSG